MIHRIGADNCVLLTVWSTEWLDVIDIATTLFILCKAIYDGECHPCAAMKLLGISWHLYSSYMIITWCYSNPDEVIAIGYENGWIQKYHYVKQYKMYIYELHLLINVLTN